MLTAAISEGLKADSSAEISKFVTSNLPVIIIGVVGVILLVVVAIIVMSNTED